MAISLPERPTLPLRYGELGSYRRSRGVRATVVAARIGSARTSISHWESGRYPINDARLTAILDAVDQIAAESLDTLAERAGASR